MNITIITRELGKRSWKAGLVRILLLGALVFSSSYARAEVFVITPDHSTTIRSGMPTIIRWDNDLETPQVHVELWDGVRGTTTVLAENVTAPQREINWTVPDDIRNGNRYRFVVRDARNARRAVFSVGFTNLVRQASTPTGIDSAASGEFSMEIAPVPAMDRVRISWTEPLKRIEIVDMTGTVVVRLEPASGAQACSVNITALSTGTYSIVGQSPTGYVVRRPLLVQR